MTNARLIALQNCSASLIRVEIVGKAQVTEAVSFGDVNASNNLYMLTDHVVANSRALSYMNCLQTFRGTISTQCLTTAMLI